MSKGVGLPLPLTAGSKRSGGLRLSVSWLNIAFDERLFQWSALGTHICWWQD